MSEAGVQICYELKAKYPRSSFGLHAADDAEAIKLVCNGSAHFALVTQEVPGHLGLVDKVLSEVEFQTVVGKGHPLYALAKSKKTVRIERILEHSFVCPNNSMLGQVGLNQSTDGWRDDRFPRKVGYHVSGLRLLEEIVVRGDALAYLPNYYAKKINAEILQIAGCPYLCKQKIRLVAKAPKDRAWVKYLFSSGVMTSLKN